jgi:NADH-ubiquinone oxidoreductase chain 5
MAIPLIILGFGSIFVGYLLKDLVIGMGSPSLGTSIFILPHHITQISGEFLSPLLKSLPVILSLLGASLAFVFSPNLPLNYNLLIFLSNK